MPGNSETANSPQLDALGERHYFCNHSSAVGVLLVRSSSPAGSDQRCGSSSANFIFRGDIEMKKLMGIVLALASIGGVGSAANASPSSAAAGQVRVQVGQGRYRRHGRWYNQRARVVTRTRIVQRGWHRYRETYQVIYRPNGMTETRLISRVRLA